MPRKKKEETKTKPTRAAKPAKKAVQAPAAKKKTTVKKSTAKPKAKVIKAVVKKTSSRVSKVLRKSKPGLEAADPVDTSAFKPMARQGETQLVAFVRDPQCVFTYWEVTRERLESVQRELKEEFKDSYMVLRLYHIDSDGAQILFNEIRLEPRQINRYVELKETGKTYVLEIAQRTPSGRYVSFAKTNPILTGPPIYTDSMRKNQTQIFLEEGMSGALLNYYHEQGYDSDVLITTEKISSAENLKRLRGINRSSSF